MKELRELKFSLIVESKKWPYLSILLKIFRMEISFGKS